MGCYPLDSSADAGGANLPIKGTNIGHLSHHHLPVRLSKNEEIGGRNPSQILLPNWADLTNLSVDFVPHPFPKVLSSNPLKINQKMCRIWVIFAIVGETLVHPRFQNLYGMLEIFLIL